MSHRFPMELWVERSVDDDGEYFNACRSAAGAASLGDVVEVARYVLAEVGEVRSEPVYAPRESVTP